MNSDGIVSSRSVLRSVQRIGRQSAFRSLHNLEQVEPDLAEYAMEELSGIYQDLGSLSGSEKQRRRIYLRVQSLVLVCIEAIRDGHYELWCAEQGEEQPDRPPESDAGNPTRCPPPPLPDPS